MTAVKPYGDSTNDGLVQLSFTLPLPDSPHSHQAAVELARKMGFERPQLVHAKAMGPDFTFFIVYGATAHTVDPDELVVEDRDYPLYSYGEVNQLIRERLKRQLVVVGACTGTDAHTVGLDAILSMKGFAGDHGLEYFPEMRVVNMGAQVTPAEIVATVEREAADAVLISQVVTQRDAHLLHLREVREALEAAGQRDRLILVGGGPRFTPQQADELGYDRIFGRGTLPSEVASYLAWRAVGERAA
ncbi:MAG TPA: OAM dimerization domain-containing protein [Actinomycetota bacterium]|nr:OAM dimerization domain-containing protein [Actinomycetota bacterium]